MSQDDGAPSKSSKLPLIIGLALMILGGGGAFYAVSSGLVLAEHEDTHETGVTEVASHEPVDQVAFVPVDPLIVNLASEDQRQRHLRFVAQLEVPSAAEEDVTLLMPRVVDMLNGYLRAVDVSVLEDPSSLLRLRAQMLRRLKIVAGDERVRDILIMEFVVN